MKGPDFLFKENKEFELFCDHDTSNGEIGVLTKGTWQYDKKSKLLTMNYYSRASKSSEIDIRTWKLYASRVYKVILITNKEINLKIN